LIVINNTRSKILDIAEDLVQRVGLNAMSYKDISDAVGIQKASIHHHFPKKEHLVDALLKRCSVSYGFKYQKIVDGDDPAPEKLRKIALIFEEGLRNKKLCLVGSISTNSNTLEEHSCQILQSTIENTVSIFTTVFEQGATEGTLIFTGEKEDAGFAFFSFLVGAQTLGRSRGGINNFQQATEMIISSYTR